MPRARLVESYGVSRSRVTVVGGPHADRGQGGLQDDAAIPLAALLELPLAGEPVQPVRSTTSVAASSLAAASAKG